MKEDERAREKKSLGWVTDIISVTVRLMETWLESSDCQQPSVGKLSLVQNDLYPCPI